MFCSKPSGLSQPLNRAELPEKAEVMEEGKSDQTERLTLYCKGAYPVYPFTLPCSKSGGSTGYVRMTDIFKHSEKVPEVR